MLGDNPAVCPGEHDAGGDGGHVDHHLHRRDRSRLSLPNQLRRAEAVSPGTKPRNVKKTYVPHSPAP